jgi:hypothetical protein
MPDHRLPPITPRPQPEPRPLPFSETALAPWTVTLETPFGPPATGIAVLSSLINGVEIVPFGGSRSGTSPGLPHVAPITLSRPLDGSTVFADWYATVVPQKPQAPPSPGKRPRLAAPDTGTVDRADVVLRLVADRPGGPQVALKLFEAWPSDWRIDFAINAAGQTVATETLVLTLSRWTRIKA